MQKSSHSDISVEVGKTVSIARRNEDSISGRAVSVSTVSYVKEGMTIRPDFVTAVAVVRVGVLLI